MTNPIETIRELLEQEINIAEANKARHNTKAERYGRHGIKPLEPFFRSLGYWNIRAGKLHAALDWLNLQDVP
jgi:hypothetical protein